MDSSEERLAVLLKEHAQDMVSPPKYGQDSLPTLLFHSQILVFVDQYLWITYVVQFIQRQHLRDKAFNLEPYGLYIVIQI